MLHDSRQIQASVSSAPKTKETQRDCRLRGQVREFECVPNPIWNQQEEICRQRACAQ
jgi:hypothetical protein